MKNPNVYISAQWDGYECIYIYLGVITLSLSLSRLRKLLIHVMNSEMVFLADFGTPDFD